MRLIAYSNADEVYIGRLAGDCVVQLAQRERFWRDPYAGMATRNGERLPLAGLSLQPAIRPAAKVVCVGLNYRAHALEAGLPIPDKPVVFSRWASTLTVDGMPSPVMEPACDWEAELGVVIGRSMLGVSEAAASQGVLGYCSFNDLSCRSLQLETAQWTLGKNADLSGPMGPVVTADESGDPSQGWRVTTHVNGELMQDGTTSDFIFSVPRLIAHVSRAMTLHPGDLIITGTPAGVGAAMKPPRYLKPGDLVRVEVAGLGAVTTPLVHRPS